MKHVLSLYATTGDMDLDVACYSMRDEECQDNIGNCYAVEQFTALDQMIVYLNTESYEAETDMRWLPLWDGAELNVWFDGQNWKWCPKIEAVDDFNQKRTHVRRSAPRTAAIKNWLIGRTAEAGKRLSDEISRRSGKTAR